MPKDRTPGTAIYYLIDACRHCGVTYHLAYPVHWNTRDKAYQELHRRMMADWISDRAEVMLVPHGTWANQILDPRNEEACLAADETNEKNDTRKITETTTGCGGAADDGSHNSDVVDK